MKPETGMHPKQWYHMINVDTVCWYIVRPPNYVPAPIAQSRLVNPPKSVLKQREWRLNQATCYMGSPGWVGWKLRRNDFLNGFMTDASTATVKPNQLRILGGHIDRAILSEFQNGQNQTCLGNPPSTEVLPMVLLGKSWNQRWFPSTPRLIARG